MRYFSLAIYPELNENRLSPMSRAGAAKERLGEALVRTGAMTDEQVKQVLLRQRERSGMDKLFGEIAVELQFVDQQTIEKMLNRQIGK